MLGACFRISSSYLVPATPSTVLSRSLRHHKFLNNGQKIRMCFFFRILKLVFVTFFTFFYFRFFTALILHKCIGRMNHVSASSPTVLG